MDKIKKELFLFDNKYQILSNYFTNKNLHFRSFIITLKNEPLVMFEIGVYEDIAVQYSASPSVLLLDAGIIILKEMITENNFTFNKGFITEYYSQLEDISWRKLI